MIGNIAYHKFFNYGIMDNVDLKQKSKLSFLEEARERADKAYKDNYCAILEEKDLLGTLKIVKVKVPRIRTIDRINKVILDILEIIRISTSENVVEIINSFFKSKLFDNLILLEKEISYCQIRAELLSIQTEFEEFHKSLSKNIKMKKMTGVESTISDIFNRTAFHLTQLLDD